jgi:hypothetical protein
MEYYLALRMRRLAARPDVTRSTGAESGPTLASRMPNRN